MKIKILKGISSFKSDISMSTLARRASYTWACIYSTMKTISDRMREGEIENIQERNF